jgi:beta-N-acetylhexosaminidase
MGLLGVACLAISAAGCAATAPGSPSSSGTSTSSASPPVTPAPTGTPSCGILTELSSWSVARLAAQLVVVPAQETDVAAAAPSVAAGAGGVILFGSSAPSDLGAQLHSLAAEAEGGLAPVVMTDEEGGGVQRMANLVGSIPWPAEMSAGMTPSAVYQLAKQTGAAMAADGVTMDLAPVLDLAAGPGPDALHTDGPRSFGLSPQIATTYGIAFAEGLEAGGVIPVVKHFPGEGSATANTDDSPASTPPLTALEAADLLPFEAAVRAGLPAVMVGNASVPGLTSQPASLSAAAIIGLLRNQLGFTGMVMTDSLSANAIGAIGLSVPQAVVEAVAAGADMVLYNSDSPNTTFQQVIAQMVAAVSDHQLPESTLINAVVQVLVTKGVNLCAGAAAGGAAQPAPTPVG